jgi:fructosamine-3-kinase
VTTPRAAAERLLGAAVTGVRSLGPVHRIQRAGGPDAVLKPGCGPGATAAEAAGLRWLGAAGAPVPAVLAVDADWLVTAWVEPGEPTRAAAEEFGRTLARTHAAGAAAFGAPPPGGPADAWIGAAPMRYEPAPDWAAWYAAERVLPHVRTAVDRGFLDPAGAAVVERACGRLPESAEPPARLHGDLWNGNVHWSAAGPVHLIDPAGHGGHRETDLAMLRLFGLPMLDRVLAAYAEVAPLADGWLDRVGAHQLFPLAVHTTLFGGGYARQLLTAARTVG